MNRVEKRRTDRTEKWFDSLTEDKKKIIYNIVNDKIRSNSSMMITISDICMVGALDDVLELNLMQIQEVMSKNNFYMDDYVKYLEKEKTGGIKMIENEVIRNEVITRIKDFMTKKVEKAKALNKLKNEFNLPYAELSDLWLECKSSKYVKPYDQTSKTIDAMACGLIREPIVKNKHLSKVPASEVIIEPIKNSSLKVINTITEIQGEFGTYIKSNDGVKVGEMLYRNTEEVNNTKNIISSKYKTIMDEIQERIKDLQLALESNKELEIKENDRFAEIESVFLIGGL